MLSEKDTILIEKYFDDELTEAEKQAFEQRKNDDLEFRKMVNAYKLTQLAFEHPLAKTLSILNELKNKDFLDETEEGFVHDTGNSLDLSSHFQPSRAYQQKFTAQAVARRSTNTATKKSLQKDVLLPLEKANFNSSIISFEFEETVPFPIKLKIENCQLTPQQLISPEQETPSETVIIPANTYSFEVKILDAEPNLYCWTMEIADRKAKRTYLTAIGQFYLRKDLMLPTEL